MIEVNIKMIITDISMIEVNIKMITIDINEVNFYHYIKTTMKLTSIII